MKKILLISGLLIFLSGLVIFFKTKIGDIRPAVLPPKTVEVQDKIQESPIIGPSEEVSEELVDAGNLSLKIPKGFSISIFAQNLNNARDLEFSPGGTLLLSIPKSGKVVALPDRDKDGKADEIKNLLTNLDNPHGLSFYNEKLFVAEEGKVNRYNFDEENISARLDKTLFNLPTGGRHFTRTIDFNKNGQMFVSLGSTCDVCYEKNDWIATVITSNENGVNPRLWAKGLRNSVFITINPDTDELWGTEMGRDFLGDDKPPDEINIIRDGKNYGWPICYGNKIHDDVFDKNQYIQNPCINSELPIYNIPAHVAPLGLTFINSQQFPKSLQGDLLVAYHGSWNRSIPIGYKVVRMEVNGNSISAESDFITGFLKGSQATGRPVDLIFDKEGSLFISDDKAGVVYKVSKS